MLGSTIGESNILEVTHEVEYPISVQMAFNHIRRTVQIDRLGEPAESVYLLALNIDIHQLRRSAEKFES